MPPLPLCLFHFHIFLSVQIGTTTKTGGNLNDPQAPLVFSTNVGDPRIPRVAGRIIFITMHPWMDKVPGDVLDKMKVEVGDLTTTKKKALPWIASLVQRAAGSAFQERFSDIRNSPLVLELPIRSGQVILFLHTVDIVRFIIIFLQQLKH